MFVFVLDIYFHQKMYHVFRIEGVCLYLLIDHQVGYWTGDVAPIVHLYHYICTHIICTTVVYNKFFQTYNKYFFLRGIQ